MPWTKAPEREIRGRQNPPTQPPPPPPTSNQRCHAKPYGAQSMIVFAGKREYYSAWGIVQKVLGTYINQPEHSLEL